MKLPVLWLFFPVFSIFSAETPAPSPSPEVPLSAHAIVLIHEGTFGETAKTIDIKGPRMRPLDGAGEVFSKDWITTSSSQTVKIIFSDKSEAWVSPNSEMVVDEISDQKEGSTDRLFLRKGTLRSLVTKSVPGKIKFRVRTPSATMGVRGTEFVTEVDVENKTSLYTLDGAVALGKNETDLDNPSTHRLVTKGMSSFLGATETMPALNTVFSRHELTKRLQMLSPELARSVNEQKNNRANAPRENDPPPPGEKKVPNRSENQDRRDHHPPEQRGDQKIDIKQSKNPYKKDDREGHKGSERSQKIFSLPATVPRNHPMKSNGSLGPSGGENSQRSNNSNKDGPTDQKPNSSHPSTPKRPLTPPPPKNY